MREATHAVCLVFADHSALIGFDKHQRVIRRFQCHGETTGIPFARALQVVRRHPEILATHPDIERRGMIARLLRRIGNLPFRSRLQFAQEGVDHRTRIETGGREFVQQNAAFGNLGEMVFPGLRNRAFLRQKRPGSVLEGDLPEFWIIDPVFPVAQIPDAASHHDRQFIGNAFFAHRGAKRFHARIGIFGLGGVFGIGKAVMPASQPGIFIDNRAQPFGHLAVSAFPERAEGTGRADNRQVIYAILRSNF